MPLSNDLISQFAKITKDNTKTKRETIVYGKAIVDGGSTYAQIDGSDIWTPVSTTIAIKSTDKTSGERVNILIKDHVATIIGNTSSPAARAVDVDEATDQIAEFDILIADKVTTGELAAQVGRIDTLVAENARISESLVAAEADIDILHAEKMDVAIANLTYASVSDLDATNATIHNLEATYGDFEILATSRLDALDAAINDLEVGDLSAKYANIDFSNIGEAAMMRFYANSGLIENVTVSDGTITGRLVGVTISGDLIEGNTVVAEKLVIKGEDGLYYKLNTDGVKTSSEQTDYNSLNGTIIKAKSITAEKVSVDDLVAFDATIGGFNITKNSLYSGVKSSVDNTTRGIYLDSDGQAAFGDASNFIKYYKDANGNHKLLISTDGVDINTAINDAAKTASNFMGYDATNGLQIGNKTGGSWSGFRTQITSAALNILDSVGNAVASYGTKLIELGKNATDAIIKLCGGKGQIEYISDEDDGNEYLQVRSNKLRLKSSEMSSLYSMYTNNSTRWEKSAVNVSPTEVGVYASECIDPTMYEMLEGWNISDVKVKPDGIDVLTPGDVNIYADGAVDIHDSTIRDSYGSYQSVIEGTSGIWSYRKYANGTVDLWGTYSVSNIDCKTALGNWYRTAVLSISNFPFTVYSPVLTANYESDGYGAVLWATTTTTNNQPPSYYLIRPTSTTIVNGAIKFHVFGRWIN